MGLVESVKIGQFGNHILNATLRPTPSGLIEFRLTKERTCDEDVSTCSDEELAAAHPIPGRAAGGPPLFRSN